MPPTYPQYPYSEPSKPRNWPKIILLTLAIIVIILGGYFIVKTFFIRGNDMVPVDNNSAGGTVPAGSGPYNCDTDTYNCADFTTQAEAQAVFDACGPEDIHRLDADGNGEACETLP